MKTRELEYIKEGKLLAHEYLMNIRQTSRGEWYNNRRSEFAL